MNAPPSLPPTESFCFWRCYSTDADLRRHITLYSLHANSKPNPEQNPTDNYRLNQAHVASCNTIDDMFYCGSSTCNTCDYDF